MDEVFSIRNGCIKTFDATYQMYSGKIYTFIFRQCREEVIAEEVVQQVFVRLWEKRESLSLQHSLSSQLFRMSKSIFIDELRKAATFREYQEKIHKTREPAYFENTLEHKEALQMVYAAIEQMPPVRKKVFEMSRLEHLSYHEIAEQLAISPKTVENHISLALKDLRSLTPLLIVFYFM
jgi:RNA polymerase sigma-70 factor (family 1)